MEHSVHPLRYPNDEYPTYVFLLLGRIQHAIRYGYADEDHPELHNKLANLHWCFGVRAYLHDV